ncbi:MAG: hypothetical protein Q4A96_01075 [Candidatus Saccharibacteria bacterium]|nr:hypothetical protein [Candidatus Saccharibacteria bacterium]
MFVGDDWKGSELFSKCEAELKKYGSTVVYFSYTQKVSSTKLREKLQLPANPTVVKIEKTESEKKQGLFARLASSFKGFLA